MYVIELLKFLHKFLTFKIDSNFTTYNVFILINLDWLKIDFKFNAIIMNSHQKKKRHVNKEDVNTVPNDDVKEIEDNNSEARRWANLWKLYGNTYFYSRTLYFQFKMFAVHKRVC